MRRFKRRGSPIARAVPWKPLQLKSQPHLSRIQNGIYLPVYEALKERIANSQGSTMETTPTEDPAAPF